MNLLEINIEKYSFIKIKFENADLTISDNKTNYVGFSTDKRNYVFEVNSKQIKIGNLANKKIYTATFLGYWSPTEEEMLSAEWEIITDKEIIKTARKEACYT